MVDETDIKDSKADDIPILPLRNMVLFPQMTMPVSVGREKSMRLIKEAEESHCSIAVFCQYDSHVDDPMERDLYRRFGVRAVHQSQECLSAGGLVWDERTGEVQGLLFRPQLLL